MAQQFVVSFYGLSTRRAIPVPQLICGELEAAETPKEIEAIICEHEAELAALQNPCDDFLVCDSAAELMADVLRSKGIVYQIICGVNDEGDSHSYVRVEGCNYDPTHQGFGDGSELEE